MENTLSYGYFEMIHLLSKRAEGLKCVREPTELDRRMNEDLISHRLLGYWRNTVTSPASTT